MKVLLQLLIVCLAIPSVAQPTGHAKIFLEITDGVDTLDFKTCFRKDEIGRKTELKYKNYQLQDIGDNKTGFQLYSRREFIHKTLMTDNHHIQIVKNKNDTMSIEIYNAFRVYFLSIPFQKGHFKLYVNDNKQYQWHINTLPFKQLIGEQIVYNISPLNWDVFEVKSNNILREYFISVQFAKQNLLLESVMPEDDPNFRNPRRIGNLRVEVADYNFDGVKDYREYKMTDTTKWNYFIYKDSISGFVLDTTLSNLDVCYFDFERRNFIGSRTTRIDVLSTQTDVYEYRDSVLTCVQQRQCVQASPNSEKTTCYIRVLEDGKWIDKEPILGAE